MPHQFVLFFVDSWELDIRVGEQVLLYIASMHLRVRRFLVQRFQYFRNVFLANFGYGWYFESDPMTSSFVGHLSIKVKS